MIVAAVSYLNTIPFVWGVEQVALRSSDRRLRGGLLGGDEVLDLVLEVPSKCASLCAEKMVDVALIPVAVIPSLESVEIITNFCLSAEGAVETVVLLSNNDDVKNIKTIYLDADSRTSVELVKILAREKWKINPTWVNGVKTDLADKEAVLAIGDKVFELEKQFSTKLDLALQWREMTGLPFVFAVWVACTPKGVEFQSLLNDALAYGVDNIDKAIEQYAPDKRYAKKYLTENIKFNMSAEKRRSMELFWQHINPG